MKRLALISMIAGVLIPITAWEQSAQVNQR